jgi:cation:H+ antiporter
MDVILLAVALVVILAGAELFTNGIEWFGRHLNLAEGAVGSVLVAVGTALPETLIPAVAILLGAHSADTSASHGVGVGAVLGAPFMLSTLAMFVTGIGVYVWAARRRTGTSLPVDTRVLRNDLGFFFVAYAIALGSALLPPAVSVLRYGVVAVLFGLYIYYVWLHFAAEPPEDSEELPPLRLRRLDYLAHLQKPHVPRLRVINLQVAVALGLILIGAVVFVDHVKDLAGSLHLDPALLALVIAPIATELPEKLNSLIWVRQGKDTLALGNITGAMVFQACFPTALAILFASEAWTITSDNLVAFGSAAICFVSTAVIVIAMRRAGGLSARILLVGGLFYVLYLGLVLADLAGIL